MNDSSADKHPIPKNYLAEPNRARSHAVRTASFTPVRHQVISRMATSNSWRPSLSPHASTGEELLPDDAVSVQGDRRLSRIPEQI